jgi:hypothetical protein
MPNTYTELRKTTVGTATNSVTFDLTGISGYTDLEIVCNYGLSTAGNTLAIQMNSVTASVHSWTWMFGDGSSATSARVFFRLRFNSRPKLSSPVIVIAITDRLC